MRVLVVGAGSTGGYFGARLAQAGRDVTFLVRPERAERLRRDGLRIVSAAGNATIAPAIVRTGEISEPYDLVLFTVKAFSLEDAVSDIAPAVGEHTSIVPFLNGMRHIDVLRERFGEGPVLGGVCIVSTTLDDDGTIRHLSEVAEIAYGERDGVSSARAEAVDRTMRGAGFATRLSTAIVHDMWQKWVMLAALGGITCTMRGTIGEVEAAPGGTAFARALLAECVAIAEATGFPMDAGFLARTDALLTAPDSGMTSSMYRDLIAGRDVEADQIIGDLIARGRATAIPVPFLAVAYANLCVYRNRLPARAVPRTVNP